MFKDFYGCNNNPNVTDLIVAISSRPHFNLEEYKQVNILNIISISISGNLLMIYTQIFKLQKDVYVEKCTCQKNYVLQHYNFGLFQLLYKSLTYFLYGHKTPKKICVV